MNPLVAEWVEKAEGDRASALREVRARKNPNYDAACFHAQQCIEKYLKAVLQAENRSAPKTHDLSRLLDVCLDKYPLWAGLRPDLEALTEYAVAYRYPGSSADREIAKQVVKKMTRICAELRRALGLEIAE